MVFLSPAFFHPVSIHFVGARPACFLDNAFSFSHEWAFIQFYAQFNFFCVACICAHAQINYNIALATIVNEKQPKQKWVVVCAFRFQCVPDKWMTFNPAVWPQCRVQIRRRKQNWKWHADANNVRPATSPLPTLSHTCTKLVTISLLFSYNDQVKSTIYFNALNSGQMANNTVNMPMFARHRLKI